MYHEGNRELQALFGSTVPADRLLERTHRTTFTDADKAFIESCPSFSWPQRMPEGNRIVRSRGAHRGS
jgi:hypothetical protein